MCIKLTHMRRYFYHGFGYMVGLKACRINGLFYQ